MNSASEHSMDHKICRYNFFDNDSNFLSQPVSLEASHGANFYQRKNTNGPLVIKRSQKYINYKLQGNENSGYSRSQWVFHEPHTSTPFSEDFSGLRIEARSAFFSEKESDKHSMDFKFHCRVTRNNGTAQFSKIKFVGS